VARVANILFISSEPPFRLALMKSRPVAKLQNCHFVALSPWWDSRIEARPGISEGERREGFARTYTKSCAETHQKARAVPHKGYNSAVHEEFLSESFWVQPRGLKAVACATASAATSLCTVR
jgi:hypothetical protein